ncbi:hypothetical protein ZEAMMB73_Zm00001d006846 [Zea mays]|uniref:Uncharacterized protein n=1 Tax=Zea mays TaxID=4577 RepID=A0A1D6F1A3_MAIZE|nr:hypothetical protein ZEAMMB73_Zm00001d006846 [Zea mays]
MATAHHRVTGSPLAVRPRTDRQTPSCHVDRKQEARKSAIEEMEDEHHEQEVHNQVRPSPASRGSRVKIMGKKPLPSAMQACAK